MTNLQLPIIPFNDLPQAIYQQQREIIALEAEYDSLELLILSHEQDIDYTLAFDMPHLKNDNQRKAHKEKELSDNENYLELKRKLRSVKANKKMAHAYLDYLKRRFQVEIEIYSSNG